MTRYLRPLVAFTALFALTFSSGLMSSGLISSAMAAKKTDHSTIVDINIERTGFLDLKTFLITPYGDDGDLGMASQRMRLISPETLFSSRPRTDFLKSFTGDGETLAPDSRLSGAASSMPDPDSVTVNVNGQPLTLSFGLKDAMMKDMQESLHTYGAASLFNGAAGFTSAAYLGTATRDILGKIDRLEDIGNGKTIQNAPQAGSKGFDIADMARMIPESSSLPLFVIGLVIIGWLHRARLLALHRR